MDPTFLMPDVYDEEYWTKGTTSNYVDYDDDRGWFASAVLLRSMLPKGARVLEVGCAYGFFVRRARVQELDCVGVDISQWAIDHAPEVARDYVQRADAAALPYDDNSFDAVVSWELLEHVPEEHVDQVLSEMERVATPEAWQVHRICLPGSDDNDVTHVTVKPKEWWYDTLGERGWHLSTDWQRRWDAAFTGRDWAGRYFVGTAT